MLGGTNAVPGMQAMRGVEVYGVRNPSNTHLRVPTFTFNIAGADPFQVAQYLWDKHSVAVLAENCGGFYSRTLQTYGKSVGIRASLVHFNALHEVETFLRALDDTVKHFAQ